MKKLLAELGINHLVDLRAVAYHVLPVATALLVTLGVATNDQATLWAGLVTAIVGPGLSFVMAQSVSNLRTALYALIAAVQAIIVGYGLADSTHIGTWMPIASSLVALLGGGVAIVNTPVTSQFSRLANAGIADPKAPRVG